MLANQRHFVIIDNMGFLRFLFAISVISAHAEPLFGLTFIGGKIAVQAFFIFSGFYMSFILQKKYSKKKNAHRLFLTNRILRVYPTYLFVLALSVILSIIFINHKDNNVLNLYRQYLSSFNPLTLGYLLFVNLFMLGMDFVMFLGFDTVHKTYFFTSNYLATHPLLYDFLFVPQAWTLSLELLFYCIAPLLVKRRPLFLCGLILLSILLRLALYHIGLHREPWTNRFFPTELVFFLGGILVYKAYSIVKKRFDTKVAVILFFLIVIFTILYGIIPINSIKLFDPVQLSYFVLLIVAIPFVFHLTRNNAADRLLGALSYPLYISHTFVINLLYFLGHSKSKLLILEILVLTLFLSVVILLFIENPVNRFRQKRIKQTTLIN